MSFTKVKNAGYDMTIIGEPCNIDAHAFIPAVLMTMLCARLGEHMYCTHLL